MGFVVKTYKRTALVLLKNLLDVCRLLEQMFRPSDGKLSFPLTFDLQSNRRLTS